MTDHLTYLVEELERCTFQPRRDEIYSEIQRYRPILDAHTAEWIEALYLKGCPANDNRL